MLDFLTLQTTAGEHSIISILYTVLLSFLLSSLVALTYEKTFRGLSYSRNFIQAMILSSIIAGMIMQAIGENPLRGLGVLGALAMIRFRTGFKDPRDIVFMFAAMAAGISCGVFGYGIAVVGTLVFCGAAIVLYFSPFGCNRYFDGMLRFNIEAKDSANQELIDIMKYHCRTFALVTLRELAQGNRLEYAYHVKLRNKIPQESLVNKIRQLQGAKDVQLLLQETTVEL
jgi:hypothetical protein